jgi:3'(2'), 5'-bisphosphate nucleotidase
MTQPDRILLDAIVTLAREAGEQIVAVYRQPFEVQSKADGSPVTEADRRAEDVIVRGLRALTPDVPVVAEEAAARGEIPAIGSRFWLVDPLDGTREFAARNGEFTVNIALVEAGVPVLGVVLAPVLGRLFAGGRGLGAWLEDANGRRGMEVRSPPADGIVAALSRSHRDGGPTEAYLAHYPVRTRIAAGSSLKFGLIAAGEADLYPRLGRTMEWDTAAGHAVLAAAGGSVTDLQGRPLRYGKPGFENPHFVARGAGSAAGGKPGAGALEAAS